MEKEYFKITGRPWRISKGYTTENLNIALNSIFYKEMDSYSGRTDFKNKFMTISVKEGGFIPAPEHLIVAARLRGEI